LRDVVVGDWEAVRRVEEFGNVLDQARRPPANQQIEGLELAGGNAPFPVAIVGAHGVDDEAEALELGGEVPGKIRKKRR